MEFGIVQKERFSATDGSYSLVTDRELYDSQITATDAETVLLRNYFLRRNEEIHIGNVKSGGEKAAKIFKLYPSGKEIHLNLVYPKPEKSELRLYLSKNAGFFPDKGDVWFLFVKKDNDSLWIGSMPEKKWRIYNSFGKNNEDDLISEEEADTIDAEIIEKSNSGNLRIDDTEPSIERPKREIIVRRREIAILRMQQSRYKCEYDPSHSLFIAKATGCPYLEAHHIIPICFQNQLHGLKLDSLNNLCCLCPSCHRAIHHAEDDVVKSILDRVSEKRNITGIFRLTKEYLYRLYAVEDIVRYPSA